MRYPKQTALVRERRAFSLREVKMDESNPGQFEGYLSVFDNVDQGDDVVVKGAFTKTLRENKERQERTKNRYMLPVLWMHDDKAPCGGILEAKEDTYGLWVRGEIDLDTELGRMVYSGMKKGYISEMSMGYITIQRQYKDGVRYLKEVRLLENSLITQNGAMNPLAAITNVKKVPVPMNPKTRRRKAASFDDAYGAAQDDLQEQWHDANVALVQVLYGILCDDTETDKPGAVGDAIDAFKAKAVELTENSTAAGFCPRLDWDDDSFADSYGNSVYGVDTDDDSGRPSYMRADHEDAETKKGAAMSATNHKTMGAALKQIKAGYGDLQALHKALSPTQQDAQENTVGAVNDPGKKARAGASTEETTHDDAFSAALVAWAAEVGAASH